MQTLESFKKFTEIEVRVIMEQLLLALDFFQKKKIVHRDIKPDNILIKSIKDKGKLYEIKVADLGLAVQTPRDRPLFMKCGSPGYIAPEIFTSDPICGQGYSYKADIFSTGSLFFNLLTGFYVFHGVNQEELILSNKMCRTDRIRPYIKQFSQECQ
jgi:calcium/calmodulin-dependent protein kinase I